MKKRFTILWLVTGLLIILSVLFYVKVGWIVWGREDLDGKRMGYSFDVATDTTANRLFVAAGNRGLHILKLDQGILT